VPHYAEKINFLSFVYLKKQACAALKLRKNNKNGGATGCGGSFQRDLFLCYIAPLFCKRPAIVMKLQQLRYALEVFRHNLNVSEAAESLFTSQPGVSKQIRLLEEELGIQIFIRSGKRIVSVSQPGKAVLQMAERILHDIQNIKNIGNEFAKQDDGVLTIAATHTAARYILPPVVASFAAVYPKVRLNIRQGTPEAVRQTVSDGLADLAVTSELSEMPAELRGIPCARHHYALIVPDSHPLLDHRGALTIALIAGYPLVTYEFAFDKHSGVARAFAKAGVAKPDVALSVADSDVLKTYVRLGLGVGIITKAAYDPQADRGLTLVDVSQLIEPCDSGIIMRGDSYLRGYIYEFVELLNPNLTKARLDQLLYSPMVEDFSI
jgi:hypothetical protein